MTLELKFQKLLKNFKLEHFFSCFLVLFWTKEIIFKYVLQIFKMVPFVGQFYELVFPILTVILLVLSYKYIISSVRIQDILFYVACVIVVLLTLLILPDNAEYLQERLYKTLVIGIPMYFIGICYSHEKFKKVLYFASLVNVICTIIYQFYLLFSGRIIIFDNMDESYKILPSVIYLCYWLFEKFNIFNLIMSVLAVFLSLSYGTRGPMLVILVFFLLAIILKVVTTKVFRKAFILWLLIILAALILMNTTVLLSISQFLSQNFQKLGLSTRIFDMFSSGVISDGAGRDHLANIVIDAIFERPFLGYGLMGDRVILGQYVHNIVLEFWCDFGLIFGSLLLCAILAIYVRAIYSQRKSTNMYFVLAMVCMIAVKLMLSSSFVYEQYFYLVLGMCISISRSNKDFRSLNLFRRE